MHYANGREAHVGDPVVGTVYNTSGIVAGTLVSLTPGPDACSAQVEWVAVTGKGAEQPRMAVNVLSPDPEKPYATRPYISRGREGHGTAGELVDLFVCRDYTHAGNLLHAEDVVADHKALAELQLEASRTSGRSVDLDARPA